jgi:hypothetical protein
VLSAKKLRSPDITTGNGCKLMRKTASALRISTADVARVEAARNGRIGRSFDDGPAVGKEGHLVGFAPEFQDEVVMAHGAVGEQARRHLSEVHGALPLVNLHGVSATESDVGSALSGEVDKVSLPASAASRARSRGGDFRALVRPDVP